jgi:hypothetical protein
LPLVKGAFPCFLSASAGRLRIVNAHFACADGMPKARRAQLGKFPDLLGGRLGAGHDFDLTNTVKRPLISKLTRGFDGAHNGGKIVISAEIVAIDYGATTQLSDRGVLFRCALLGRCIET